MFEIFLIQIYIFFVDYYYFFSAWDELDVIFSRWRTIIVLNCKYILIGHNDSNFLMPSVKNCLHQLKCTEMIIIIIDMKDFVPWIPIATLILTNDTAEVNYATWKGIYIYMSIDLSSNVRRLHVCMCVPARFFSSEKTTAIERKGKINRKNNRLAHPLTLIRSIVFPIWSAFILYYFYITIIFTYKCCLWLIC